MADSTTPAYILKDPAYLSENYNKDHRMVIDLDEMYDAGHVRIDFLAQTVADTWTAAMQTWNDLLLSWSGATAEASKELQQKITDVQHKLMGTPSAADPTKADPIGILGQIQSLIGTANMDLDLAESSVKKSFADLTDSFNRSAGGGEVIWFDVNKDGTGDIALPAGKQAADQTTGPVSETYSHPIDRGHTDGKHVGAPPPEDPNKPYKSPEEIQREELRELGEQKKHGGGGGSKV
jgi:hypothetical protein